MQSCSHRIGERKFENDAGFSLRNSDLTVPPVNVIQGQRGDVTGPQPIDRHQKEHRKIAQPGQAGTVNGMKDRLHRLPRQSAGQLFLPIDARSIEFAIQPETAKSSEAVPRSAASSHG